MRARLALIAAAAAAAAVVVVLLLGGDEPSPTRQAAERARDELAPRPLPPQEGPRVPVPRVRPSTDPFAYDPRRRREFERRAAAGNAHVLYAQSPDGVIATAERVDAWRAEIEAAAATADVDADRLEALVFLESAGRDQVVAPQGIEGAAGLTQIVAGTGIDLLGMDIDVERSTRLSARIERATRPRQVRRLVAKRKRVDPRFDAVKALAATGSYLSLAEERLRSEELAFVSYHMGIGNLEGAIAAYAGGPTDEPLPYAQLYFDSSPTRNAEAWRRLYELGDDSSNYLWKLLAAEEIMALWREDPAALGRRAELQLSKNSAEEVLHPEDETPAFATPGEVRDAYADGTLLRLPAAPGLRYAPKMGRHAKRLDVPMETYRGLRPEALATLVHIGATVDASVPGASLKVTSTVRDRAYQAELVGRNDQATPNFSLHTTGYSFDIARKYASDEHARAFQAILDRLKSLNVIAYVYEPAAIHVTVSSDGAAFEGLIEPAP